MIRLAVFGHPVTHSLSPRIHRLFATQADLDLRYDAIDAAPGTLAGALNAFAAAGGEGCNVTLPLKEEARDLAVRRSEQVERARAANTLRRGEDGWVADNTDGVGLVSDLLRLGLDPAGRRIALLGAGGAAAGVTAALLAARPERLVILNRSLDRARALASAHADLGPVDAVGLETLTAAPAPFDLVLNATSLGHTGGRPSLTASLFADNGFLYDLNYGPAAEPLAAWAAKYNIPYAPGLGMLVGQAAESFRLWTGYTPDPAPVLEALSTPG